MNGSTNNDAMWVETTAASNDQIWVEEPIPSDEEEDDWGDDEGDDEGDPMDVEECESDGEKNGVVDVDFEAGYGTRYCLNKKAESDPLIHKDTQQELLNRTLPPALFKKMGLSVVAWSVEFTMAKHEEEALLQAQSLIDEILQSTSNMSHSDALETTVAALLHMSANIGRLTPGHNERSVQNIFRYLSMYVIRKSCHRPLENSEFCLDITKRLNSINIK